MSGCIALVVAGGRGSRFGPGTPKQYRLLGGRPVIRYSLETFLSHPGIDAVQPVIHADDGNMFATAAAGLDVLAPTFGGTTRQDSVRHGLEAVTERAPERVLIHDAARPFVSPTVIDRVLAALGQVPGAIPALPVADTLKRGGHGQLITATVDRAGLWRAQTPQGFRFAEILDAHRRLAGRELTDDAALFEQSGLAVALVQGSEENQKVTTSEDLRRAERLLRSEIRTGSGFDVHAVEPGDHVVLCGVPIPAPFSLKGHSDADVAMHAVTDALMGAVAGGDIGRHFPPSDERWRGAASSVFLAKAADLVAEAGGRIVNVDLTIICERPRIGPHVAAMQASLAEILGVQPSRISVKATTTEMLGFTGRGEGLAAQAVASVEVPRD